MNRILMIAFLLPVIALADPQPFMTKANPEQIYIDPTVGAGCPISEGALIDEISGPFVRARIKLLSEIDELPVLFVTLDCQEVLPDQKNFIWIFFADFVGSAVLADGNPYPVRYGTEVDYAFFGRGDWDSARSAIREQVENLVTDYLKANFDLGETNRGSGKPRFGGIGIE